jgi:hypothetical protein
VIDQASRPRRDSAPMPKSPNIIVTIDAGKGTADGAGIVVGIKAGTVPVFCENVVVIGVVCRTRRCCPLPQPPTHCPQS